MEDEAWSAPGAVGAWEVGGWRGQGEWPYQGSSSSTCAERLTYGSWEAQREPWDRRGWMRNGWRAARGGPPMGRFRARRTSRSA